MKIGKIASDTWRNTHVLAKTQYDALNYDFPVGVTDFSAAQRAVILAANAQKYLQVAASPVPPAKVPRAGVLKSPAISDVSGAKLYIPGDFVIREAQVDHIIPFRDWGCNDIRNARVLSKQENLTNTIRPTGHDVELIALEDFAIDDLEILDRNGNTVSPPIPGGLVTKSVIPLANIKWLLALADDKFASSHTFRVKPTHGRGTTLNSVGDMTDADCEALLNNITTDDDDDRKRPKKRKFR